MTCYHECGHAVMAYLLGGRVEWLSLFGDEDCWKPHFGVCRVRWMHGRLLQSTAASGLTSRWSEDADRSLRELATLMAGPIAQRIYEGVGEDEALRFVNEDGSGWSDDSFDDDLQRAAGLATRLLGDASSVGLRRLVREVDRMFRDDRIWPAIAALADELEAHESLGSDEVAETLDFWL